MHTSKFNIFNKMVNIAKQKNLNYVIMYSYNFITKGSYPYSYNFILSTELFTVSFRRKYKEDDETIMAIKEFIKHNDCIELDCKITINEDNNNIELH